MKTLSLALITMLSGTLVPALALAADSEVPILIQQKREGDRQSYVAQLRQTQVQLAEALGTGKGRAHYRQTLEERGYHITSVNKDDPDYLEYEIIKAGDSYEVQVDFKGGVSTFIEVTPNIWKSKATREALKDENYRYTYPASVIDNAHEVSDRSRGKAWAEEKPAVEKELGVGHERSYYQAVLQKMGFTITSANANDAKNLELEAVRGYTHYEVTVQFDPQTLMSTAVDVSPSSSQSESTASVKNEK